MAARSKKGKASAIKPVIAETTPRPLKAYYHGGGVVSSFGSARFYWPGGDGDRESIEPRITKKRRPAGAQSNVDTAAKIEVLLPGDAPQDYADVDFLIRHYEMSLSPEETTAFIQITIRFGDSPNLHRPYEAARAWLRSFYASEEGHGVPVLLILHAPHLAGSSADGHVHAIVFPRRLSRFGWTGGALELGSDGAAIKARVAWGAFRNAAKSSETM
jgi:hypothetical protein